MSCSIQQDTWVYTLKIDGVHYRAAPPSPSRDSIRVVWIAKDWSVN